jgi:23S rRNA pseudouridine955/2504/2580 synthase
MKKLNLQDLVLFENKDVMVLNKPPYISSLDERDETRSSIIKLLRAQMSDPQLCHRLDKETSGALVIAKNPETYRAVSMEFEHRRVIKTYHAIADGVHSFDNHEVFLPITQTSKGNVRIDFKTGKEAVTYFTTLKNFKNFTLIKCTPITGRMHQIRIHLSSQRAPIASDIEYGGQMPMLSTMKRKYSFTKWEEEQTIMRRVALHAQRIKFNLKGEDIEVTAPYPKDFDVFLKLLEKFNL